ncbi:MAG: beta-ketoacyl-ACP synthase II [Chloroflexota bacterium]
MEKVVITGLGAISPIGNTFTETWENMKNGVPGAGPITLYDPAGMEVHVACEVKNFDPKEHFKPKEVRRRDRFQQFAAVAVAEAIAQSGLQVTEENAPRIGVVLSTGIGGLSTLEANMKKIIEGNPRKVSPFLIPMLMGNGAAGMAGIDHGFQGPSFSVTSACASGQDGIGMAWLMLRAGMVDAVVAGASEAILCISGMAGFNRIGALSRRGSDEKTPSPFDLERDGLVAGEGAAVLVLERESFAKQRGADILAELAGYGSTSDAHHVTAPHHDGKGGASAIKAALQVSGVALDEIGYVNAHGTGTPLNDAAETAALKQVFGERAYQLPVSSTKSMTGHLMGATGALETAILVNVIREGVLPPTINYQTPDPDCDLDYVPNQARQQPVEIAISNAFGFGGHNAVLVVRGYH